MACNVYTTLHLGIESNGTKCNNVIGLLDDHDEDKEVILY